MFRRQLLMQKLATLRCFKRNKGSSEEAVLLLVDEGNEDTASHEVKLSVSHGECTIGAPPPCSIYKEMLTLEPTREIVAIKARDIVRYSEQVDPSDVFKQLDVVSLQEAERRCSVDAFIINDSEERLVLKVFLMPCI